MIFLVAFIYIVLVYLQIIKSDFGSYRYFKVASTFLRSSLTSPEGPLYKLNMIRLRVLVTN